MEFTMYVNVYFISIKEIKNKLFCDDFNESKSIFINIQIYSIGSGLLKFMAYLMPKLSL